MNAKGQKSLERYDFITACQKEDLEKFVRFIYNGPLI